MRKTALTFMGLLEQIINRHCFKQLDAFRSKK